MTKVSIIIPAYNEHRNIRDVVGRVMAATLPSDMEREILIIDDGSTDGTAEILDGLRGPLVQVHHTVLNFGKGTAIRVGLKQATGSIVVIQDADAEYDPEDIQKLLRPILDGKATVVYGSRFLGKISNMRFKYRLANKLLVLAVKILFGSSLTDEATAYKAFTRDVIQNIPLNCRRFEFCPEVTAKILRKRIPIYEVPIRYSARTVEEGKKIRLSDAFEAFWTLLRYRFSA